MFLLFLVGATPWKLKMDPEHQLFEEEHHLNQTCMTFGSMLRAVGYIHSYPFIARPIYRGETSPFIYKYLGSPYEKESYIGISHILRIFEIRLKDRNKPCYSDNVFPEWRTSLGFFRCPEQLLQGDVDRG